MGVYCKRMYTFLQELHYRHADFSSPTVIKLNLTSGSNAILTKNNASVIFTAGTKATLLIEFSIIEI